MKFNNANQRGEGDFTTDLSLVLTRSFSAYTPYPINEEVYGWTVFTWRGWVNSEVVNLGRLCSSRVRMSTMVEYRVQRHEFFELSLPVGCFRHNYEAKTNIYQDAYNTLNGAFNLATNADYSDDWVFRGTITNTEGIYYSDFQFAYSVSYNFPNTYNACPYANYRGFYDNDIPNLSRFQYRQRIKIIVDDEYLDPPQTILNFPDVEHTVGHQYVFNFNLATYFDNCSYLKAKQSNVGSSALPSWLVFHEMNTTFVGYPPNQAEVVSIQVYCYNLIGEFDVNTFTITIVNEVPVIAYEIPDYILQWDSVDNIG